MSELLIASSNQGKCREFASLLRGEFDRVLSLANFPDIVLPPEDGVSFVDNALIKARHAAEMSGMPALADDSGLEVQSLGGRPGVMSARFAGENSNDAGNNAKLLYEMRDVSSELRSARFVCCIAFCFPGGNSKTFEGELYGTIITAPRGDNGFGYDPLFLVDGYGKTMAELDLDVKNRISHRARAFEKFRRYLHDGLG